MINFFRYLLLHLANKSLQPFIDSSLRALTPRKSINDYFSDLLGGNRIFKSSIVGGIKSKSSEIVNFVDNERGIISNRSWQ